MLRVLISVAQVPVAMLRQRIRKRIRPDMAVFKGWGTEFK
jgi:hypothetical protein